MQKGLYDLHTGDYDAGSKVLQLLADYAKWQYDDASLVPV